MSSDLKITQHPVGQTSSRGEPPAPKKKAPAKVYQPPKRNLKFVRGPETAKALVLDTPKRSFLDFAVSALTGKEKSDAAFEARIKELDRKYPSKHDVDALTRQYIELAARA